MYKDMYITNYCDSRCTPLSSVTKLPMEEAYLLAKKLSEYTSDSFTSFSRFSDKDFDGYYKKRVRTEEWLYHSFIAIGGKPHNKQPLYFVLGESNYLNTWFDNGLKTQLLLKDIDARDISFTYGDSMSKMDAEDRMNLFTIETLFDFIHQTTYDVEAFLHELNMQNKYIEVQLWNDKYINN